MNLVLALYPNVRGFGYVCLELPQKLLDSGVITVRPVCNGRSLKRIQKFIAFFKPKIVVLRDNGTFSSRRSKRIQHLIDEITAHAQEKQIPVFKYSRRQIRDVFELSGATTKYEIAQKVIERFPELSARAPKIRKAWMEEDYNMGIFDALSLAIAHEYLTG